MTKQKLELTSRFSFSKEDSSLLLKMARLWSDGGNVVAFANKTISKRPWAQRARDAQFAVAKAYPKVDPLIPALKSYGFGKEGIDAFQAVMTAQSRAAATHHFIDLLNLGPPRFRNETLGAAGMGMGLFGFDAEQMTDAFGMAGFGAIPIKIETSIGDQLAAEIFSTGGIGGIMECAMTTINLAPRLEPPGGENLQWGRLGSDLVYNTLSGAAAGTALTALDPVPLDEVPAAIAGGAVGFTKTVVDAWYGEYDDPPDPNAEDKPPLGVVSVEDPPDGDDNVDRSPGGKGAGESSEGGFWIPPQERDRDGESDPNQSPLILGGPLR